MFLWLKNNVQHNSIHIFYTLHLVAFNKSVTLSSQYHQLTPPSNAVDGITKCPDYTFLASTDFTQNRWISIQLGGTYNIKMVAIHARTDWHGMWIWITCQIMWIFFFHKSRSKLHYLKLGNVVYRKLGLID